jgi:hypothetical protein
LKDEHLLTANGTVATADGGTTPKQHDGWMSDLTVPVLQLLFHVECLSGDGL